MKEAEILRNRLAECLLRERDAGAFLRCAFEVLAKHHGETNFADLARRMGFSSRSFVRSLSLGTRKPTLANFRQIAQGLRMSSEATEFFGLLVEKDSRRSNSRPRLQADLEAAENKLRKSLLKRIRKHRKVDPVPFAK